MTHAYFVRPRLITIVVATASATTASSWFATPKSGHTVLMLPVQMKYAHANTIRIVATTVPGSQSVRANGFQARPRNSCSRNRPMRVPESIVVRMNTASNMMAKWYQ